MRTSLNLNETLMADPMKATKAQPKTKAIHLAMTNFIRQKKIERLKVLSGTISLT